MSDTLTTIIVAVIGSGALSALIAGIFNLIMSRKGRLAAIENELNKMNDRLINTEKDELRTQLLLLMSDYPLENQEIMKLAEHYFKDLKGNWYASTLFDRWLNQNHLPMPKWFHTNED